MVFHQGELAASVRAWGRQLHYYISPDHADLDTINAVLLHLVKVRRGTEIETINDMAAPTSPYLAALDRLFTAGYDHKRINLEMRRV